MATDMIYGSGSTPASVAVYIEGINNVERPAQRSLLQIIDRADPIIVSGVRQVDEIELRLATLTTADRDTLWAIILAQPVIRVVPVNASTFGVAATIYLAVGDVTESRTSPLGDEPSREWTIPGFVVAKPAGWLP